MKASMDIALNILYQRQIISREQLLTEMLRVKLTQRHVQSNKTKDQLFKLMKGVTEEQLGFFPADRDDFAQIFDTLKSVDPLEFTLYIYKNDRVGTVMAPACLGNYIGKRIQDLQPERVLIPDAEKHLSALNGIIKLSPTMEVTLTTQHKLMYLLLELAFGEYKNVQIKQESIYSDCLLGKKYDYIYLLPTFGGKVGESSSYISRDSDDVAIENMLRHLDRQGTLDAVVPAKITFASGGSAKLREYIMQNFNLQRLHTLPEGTFRPATGIKTYFLTITTRSQPAVEIGRLEMNKDKLDVADKQSIPMDKFKSHDWRIELLLCQDDEHIRRFRDSDVEKVKLKDIAEIFRGKSVLKKDVAPGKISVLNISNIEDGEVSYDSMDTIDEDERKVKRYELASGDVLLSSRGTAIKSAVFNDQGRPIIASANLIVIRPMGKVRGELIKVFLESPVGIAMVKSFQRGTTVMNINYQDIAEMEAPLLPEQEQQEVIEQYQGEFKQYKQTISQAESRWADVKKKLYNKLT